MSKDFYKVLWVDKQTNEADIKKAYRKQAMKYHPDRNKWDKTAETKFKEINEAYSVLSDDKKRKQYDTFWSTSSSFWWWASWFEDMYSGWFWQSSGQNSSFDFDLEDLFWGFSWQTASNWFWSSWQKAKAQTKKKPETLDFEKTYEVPIFDLILGCKIEVKGVYWTKAKLKIPVWTQHWTKFRVKWFWKKEGTKAWNLLVIIKALMPKDISDVDLQMLERIRENVGY